MDALDRLALDYYGAVDMGNESLAGKLLAELLDIVNNDGRVLSRIVKYGYHGKEDILAELNVVIWSTSRYPEKRWNPMKKANFSTWIVKIVCNKAYDYNDKLNRNKTRFLGPIDVSKDDDRRYRKKSDLWDEKVTPFAWEKLSPEQKIIINMKREGIKGIKIAEELGWDPSRVTKEKEKAIKLIKGTSDELGSFMGVDFYRIMFVDVSLLVGNN